MTDLRAMPWPGAKSSRSPTGRWVNSLLPTDVELYAEVCAGMLGCLCQREPVKVEVVNDLDDNLYNWWSVVRDAHDALKAMLKSSPIWSLKLWREARSHILDRTDISDPIRWAYWYTIAIYWAFSSAGDLTGVKRFYGPDWGSSRSADITPRLDALAARLRYVHIECRDAVWMLDKLAHYGPEALIYVDPPYRDADPSLYRRLSLDRGAMGEVMRVAKSRIAVSGYGDEWDHLGWQRHDFATYTKIRSPELAPIATRTEVLWTNYEPQVQTRLPGIDGAPLVLAET